MTKYAVCASILMLLSSTLTASAEHDDPAWIVHREYPGPFHLGDENISSWASLVGPCLDVTFPAVESGGKVQLSYEPYGVENAYLELDDGRRFSLAPQVVQSGTRPNYWGAREYIIIDVPQSSGSMSGRVCSDFLDPTDLDDLMLQNLTTLGLPPTQPVNNAVTNDPPNSLIPKDMGRNQPLDGETLQNDLPVGTELLSQRGSSQGEFQCVEKRILQSRLLQPAIIRGAIGVSGSYCMGVVDFVELAQGRPAILGQDLTKILELTKSYDEHCDFDYGPAPITAFSGAKLQISSFGPTHQNWVRAINEDCGAITRNLAQFVE